MNGDFVLLIKETDVRPKTMLEIWDGPEGMTLPLAAVASFLPTLPSNSYEPIAADLFLVIDCSASMVC